MAGVNTNDVLRVTANLVTVDLGEVQNVFTTKVTAAGTGTVVVILDKIVIILELVYAIVKGLQNTRTKYIDVDFYNVTQDIPLPTRAWPTITQGELAADDLAHMTSAMISFGVSLPGVQGRKYFGGISETALDQDGLWATATVVDLALAGATMIVNQTQGDTTIQYGVMTGVTPAFVQFDSVTARNVPSSQRRRRQGVGV